MENRQLRKQQPPQRMLFWQFLGRENIFFTEGDQWRKHSRIFKAAMQRTMPIEHFIATSRRLLALLGDGGKVNWSDLTHRFTLDVVGATVLGYDFAALDHPHGSFVAQYHEVMTAISDPLYIFLPMLEWLIPRHEVRRKIDNLLEKFGQLLAKKQKDPGNDVITYMWEEPDMTETEMRDSVVVTFIAGHVSIVRRTRHGARADPKEPDRIRRLERSPASSTIWECTPNTRNGRGRRCSR